MVRPSLSKTDVPDGRMMDVIGADIIFASNANWSNKNGFRKYKLYPISLGYSTILSFRKIADTYASRSSKAKAKTSRC